MFKAKLVFVSVFRGIILGMRLSKEKDTWQKLVAKYAIGVDHILLRVAESAGTVVSIRNGKIENVSLPTGFAGSIRVLVNGGWGQVAFNDVTQLETAIQKAITYAKLVGKSVSYYGQHKAIKRMVAATAKQKDFLAVSLAEKVAKMQRYELLAQQSGKAVINTSAVYTDKLVSELIITSDGSVIEQEKPYVYSMLNIIGREAGVIQHLAVRLSDTNYAALEGKETEIREAGKTVDKLVAAPSVVSGDYTVVVDPKLAGVFAHEAFGHLSEADNVDEDETLRKIMRLGRDFGNTDLAIVDDPTLKGYRGGYEFDSEGTPAKKQYLLKDGVLVGRLHSRETAARLGEEGNGHARADSVTNPPLVRMGITYIVPGKASFPEMIAGIANGLYCINWQAGNTDHESFTFKAGYAREIKNGKLGRIVRDAKLTGNLFRTLKEIDMIGSDLEMSGGTCGKGGQYVPENSGGPHIRFRKIKVIGA